MQQPRVSVIMIAYNVERFVQQAIDSVFMQQVDFRFELVIGEDCSTDATREILTRNAQEHPDVIRLIAREVNLGMNANFFATLGESRGQYIALLDGDDYWTSPHKLQQQVEFLEAHPNYSISFHNALVVYEDGIAAPHPFHMRRPTERLSQPLPKETSTLADLVGGNFMQTGSVMFRASQFEGIPEWFLRMPTFDWPLHVRNARMGLINYRDEIMSAYRVHQGGMWSTNMSRFCNCHDVDEMLQAYGLVDRYLDGRYHALIHSRSRWLFEAGADLLYRQGRVDEANRYVMRYLHGVPKHRWLGETGFLLRMLRARHPALAGMARRLRTAFKRDSARHHDN